MVIIPGIVVKQFQKNILEVQKLLAAPFAVQLPQHIRAPLGGFLADELHAADGAHLHGDIGQNPFQRFFGEILKHVQLDMDNQTSQFQK